MMSLRTLILSGLAAGLLVSAPARAQQVEATALPPLDFFSASGRPTGLAETLWDQASARTLRTVLPLLAERPLSPAAEALARRLLAAGARGPEGAGDDPEVAARRLQALMALGDTPAARTILGRTAGLARSEPLSRAAAEAALLAGEDQAACDIGRALSVDRDQVYWLRLRAFCQAQAGETPAAQLTYDLAQGVARDAVFARLMGAILTGAEPGAGALRGGLDYALSRRLGLDLSAVEAPPAMARALAGEAPPREASWNIVAGPGPLSAAVAVLAQGDLDLAENLRAVLAEPDAEPVDALGLALLDALIAAARGRQDRATLDRLVERGGVGEARDRRRAQDGALILAALGTPFGADARGEFAAFPIAQGKAPPARLAAMDQAAEAGLVGETALLALWTSAEAGLAGPSPADRARIIRALRAAGLDDHAREFAVEGLLALR